MQQLEDGGWIVQSSALMVQRLVVGGDAGTGQGVLWGFERREAETEFAGERPPRVFLRERKSSKDFLMRQLRYFWDQWWSLLRTKKQTFEFA